MKFVTEKNITIIIIIITRLNIVSKGFYGLGEFQQKRDINSKVKRI